MTVGRFDAEGNLDSSGEKALQFLFDISNTPLVSAPNVSIHWTMTCANDVVQGTKHLGPPPPSPPTTGGSAPEPGSLALLMAGLVGLRYRKGLRSSGARS